MGFFNKYPYLDMHELNLDWLLAKMQELDKRLDDALETLSAEVYKQVMEDVSVELNEIRGNISGIQSNLTELTAEYVNLISTFRAFEIYVENKFDTMRTYIDDRALSCNEYTNIRISQNNDFILSELSQYLRQIKVINFFTGEMVSIQDMLDYLASLHATDSLDYDTMASRSKTYTQLAAFNKTYTELVTNGNTWYI